VSLPLKRTQPHERSSAEVGVSFGGAAAARAVVGVVAGAGAVLAPPGSQVLRDTQQVLRALSPGGLALKADLKSPPTNEQDFSPPQSINVSAACLGGRHAYKALLSPLKLPVEPPVASDSPKRLRTATGRTAGTPTSDLVHAANFSLPPSQPSSAVRKVGAKSPLMGAKSPLSRPAINAVQAATAAAAAAAAAAVAAVTGGERASLAAAGPLTMRATSGTEAPGVTPSPTSPMSELLSFSMFNDLFAGAAAGAEPPKRTITPSVVIAVPTGLPSPRLDGNTTPGGGPVQATVAPASASGGRRSMRAEAQRSKQVKFAASLA